MDSDVFAYRVDKGRLVMANVGCQFDILAEEEASFEEFSPPHWLIGSFLDY